MKDLLGREVEIGNYICYALTAGRNANLAIYQVREVFQDKIKAVKIDSTYRRWNGLQSLDTGEKVPFKYCTRDRKLMKIREMTTEEKSKIDNKVSTLSVSGRVFILDGFTKDLFEKDRNEKATI